MKLGKNSDLPVDYSMNDSTNLSPNLDPHPTQEDSKDLLPSNDKLVQFTSEFITDSFDKKQQGFPTIGCLITLFVLAIFGFLTLPSLLSCVNKAKQAEAKNIIGAMNRSQQAYQLEYGKFANSLTDLGVGIRTQTDNYQYSIRATKTAAFNYAIARRDYTYETVYFGPFHWQKRTDIRLKSYVGGVFSLPATQLDPKADKKEILTIAIACESLSYGTTKPVDPILQNGVASCGSGTRELSRKQK